ncbi:hypothetical protein K457DRAFT_124305 [Linnemannia elongata AG-77]|uniref:Yeast cell wall synthesis Kre9/Knh1-like N-terminal domain-containing protein n=1 Tax=Linnemannia elongata AG-77 TaxID=1314771 RepID=A0A197K114_9FUNG|nr:hypothetical protein K457DRAFT_124305 [Linnemannia elongata AG-77]
MHAFSPLLVVATLLALVSTAFADLVVTSPNTSSFVVAGGQLPIAWSYSGPQPPSPATISVELVDNSKALFTGPLALFSNLATSSGGASWSVPKLGFAGANFSVLLIANVNNQATIFAQGPAFSIMPEGTAPPASTGTTTPTSAAAAVSRWEWAGKGVLALTSTVLVWMHL